MPASKALLLSLLPMLGLVAAACGSDSSSTDEANVTACANAHVDENGYCRADNGTFAPKTCCAPADACAAATIDDHGICRREDNGQFSPTACCDALCGNAKTDAKGVCRTDAGRFALGACCADDCVRDPAAAACHEEAVTVDQFVLDFKDALDDWYNDLMDDPSEFGGNTLSQAKKAVKASKVTLLTNPDDDPNAHDFAEFIVFSHPDVVNPGSDTVWFGAYNRETGELDEVYAFN